MIRKINKSVLALVVGLVFSTAAFQSCSGGGGGTPPLDAKSIENIPIPNAPIVNVTVSPIVQLPPLNDVIPPPPPTPTPTQTSTPNPSPTINHTIPPM